MSEFITHTHMHMHTHTHTHTHMHMHTHTHTHTCTHTHSHLHTHSDVATYGGKEVISQFTTDIMNDGVWYTDANGREMQKRT